MLTWLLQAIFVLFDKQLSIVKLGSVRSYLETMQYNLETFIQYGNIIVNLVKFPRLQLCFQFHTSFQVNHLYPKLMFPSSLFPSSLFPSIKNIQDFISSMCSFKIKVSNFIRTNVCCLSFHRILQAVFERFECFSCRHKTLRFEFESRLFNWVLTSPRLELQMSFKVTKTISFSTVLSLRSKSS